MTIQWRSVWMAVVGLAIIGAIFGLEWMFAAQNSIALQTRSEPGLNKAITTITFEELKPSAERKSNDPTIRDCAPNLEDFVQTLRSRRIARMVLSSYTPDDLATLSTPDHRLSGVVHLGKISFIPSRPSQSIAIAVLHPRADAAKMVANRYCLVFSQYLFGDTNKPSSIIITQDETRVEKVHWPWILSRILK